jgi:hypothetical protein
MNKQQFEAIKRHSKEMSREAFDTFFKTLPLKEMIDYTNHTVKDLCDATQKLSDTIDKHHDDFMNSDVRSKKLTENILQQFRL